MRNATELLEFFKKFHSFYFIFKSEGKKETFKFYKKKKGKAIVIYPIVYNIFKDPG